MNKLSNYLNYLCDCYQADNQEAIISNIFDSKFTNHLFLEEEELLTGDDNKILIKSASARSTEKKAYIYRKEKELLYCSTFLIGSIKKKGLGKDRICAPLFLYPAKIKTDKSGKSTITIDKNSLKINFGLLSLLSEDNDYAIKLYDKIFYQIIEKNGVLKRDNILELISFIENDNIKINTRAFTLYPLLVNKNSLNSELVAFENKSSNNFKLINSGVVILTNKSKLSRGVIDEVKNIAKKRGFSKPLNVLFNLDKNYSPFVFNFKKGYTPSILSHSQELISKSCRKNPLTLVIGPPGTGKSYTIASVALEHLSRGESVLIASKMDHAVDVIGKKIEKQLGVEGAVVRGGDKQYLRDLKKYLKELLSNIYNTYIEKDLSDKKLSKVLRSLDKDINRLTKKYRKEVKIEKSRGSFIFNGLKSLNLLNRIRYDYISRRKKHSFLLSNITAKLEELLKTKNKIIIKLIKSKNNSRIRYTLNNHRSDLMDFDKAIRSRTDAKQEKIFKKINFRNLLETFPIWLLNLGGIFNVLPLKKELFDLAIIDEATQCDITSCLPILYRAKRVAIVGDPNQLRYLSFLSKYRQFTIGNKYSLPEDEISHYNYRTKSILDITNENIKNQDKIFFLDEHYRSLPQVISFSNNEFYDNSLKIMTEKPGHIKDTPIEIIKCNGNRKKSGINSEEADQIISRISEIVKLEENSDNSMSCSIGVLSPFRNQVDYIYKKLMSKFSIDTLEKHNILVGTAHTFQGEERDIIFISFSVDKNCHNNTFYFLSKPDVLNVSITRARVKQYVCISIDPKLINKDLLIRKYLEFIINQDKNKIVDENDFHDIFLKDVIKSMKNLGISTYPSYSIAGLIIDLVIEYKNKTYGIDLIGYPGEFFESFSLERYQMYYRADLKVIPLAYSDWHFNKENCIKDIKEKINFK